MKFIFLVMFFNIGCSYTPLKESPEYKVGWRDSCNRIINNFAIDDEFTEDQFDALIEFTNNCEPPK